MSERPVIMSDFCRVKALYGEQRARKQAEEIVALVRVAPHMSLGISIPASLRDVFPEDEFELRSMGRPVAEQGDDEEVFAVFRRA